MYLPYEIVFEILLRLPIKSLLRLKLVCRLWHAMISDPYFNKAHLERAKDLNEPPQRRHLVIRDDSAVFSVGYEDFNNQKEHATPFQSFLGKAEILASCDGLLLVGDSKDSYYLWNPTTSVHKMIKGPSFYEDHCKIYGLGYDQKSGAYKFVRAVRVANYRNFLRHPNKNNPNEYDATVVKVYNSKTECWRRIYDFPYLIFKTSQGVVVNGIPHWMVFRDDDSVEGIRDFVIIYFDLVEDKFKELPTPDWLYSGSKFHFCAFEESLCLLKYVEVNPNRDPARMFSNLMREWEIDVWVMRQYGSGDSWTNLFSLNDRSCGEELVVAPLCFRRDGKVLMEKVGQELVIYDPSDRNVRSDHHEKVFSLHTYRSLTTAAYVESLVSPHGGTDIVG